MQIAVGNCKIARKPFHQSLGNKKKTKMSERETCNISSFLSIISLIGVDVSVFVFCAPFLLSHYNPYPYFDSRAERRLFLLLLYTNSRVAF